MNYGKAIRIARSIADLSQARLAELSDIDRSYLSLIEGGNRTPSMETLTQISNALKIPFHLFTLLATEKGDATSIGHDHLHNLAIELTHLLLEYPQDYDQLSLGYPDRRESTRPRAQTRNKKRTVA
ncbi:MAG TPA: helix-turn-helix transcriptional regulator [Acidobacteriaceae bacterium]